MSVMLYKAPGKEKLHGVMVETSVVDEEDVKSNRRKGWHMTPADAHEAHLKSQLKKSAAEPQEE